MSWRTNHLPQLLFITVILLWQCISNADAIKCFICDSSVNPGCTDLKSNSSIVAEECSLEKMKSVDSWLFDLNKISYFPTLAYKTPVMYCQKVVAKDPNTNTLITARFCQMDLVETDPCTILRNKLNNAYKNHFSTSTSALSSSVKHGGGGNGNGNSVENSDDEDGNNNNDDYFCSHCDTDECNGVATVHANVIILSLMTVVALPTILLMNMQLYLHERMLW